MVTVRFYTLLRLLVGKEAVTITFEKGETVRTLLEKAVRAVDIPFLHKLTREDGDLKTGTMILQNGRNIFHLERLDTTVEDGDTVDLFPPGGGG